MIMLNTYLKGESIQLTLLTKEIKLTIYLVQSVHSFLIWAIHRQFLYAKKKKTHRQFLVVNASLSSNLPVKNIGSWPMILTNYD